MTKSKLSQNGHERVERRGTYDDFVEICVGETDTGRLVDEEDVSVRVPGVRVVFGFIGRDDVARSWRR